MAAYVSARSSDVDMHVGVLTAVCWLWTWLQEALYVQGEALGLDEETVRDALEAFDGDYAVRHMSKPIRTCRNHLVVMMSRSVTSLDDGTVKKFDSR